ncbi:MAG: hypothetical protein KGS09_08820 [Nitrospirae bacterium]|nr:hypothetical protein [Nitrospirota bacterium]MBU6480627.1 hypothetical protein [Nitrospirota bacterium]MDE3048871.1 hypothetical protein [Nitrospirota bacterium]MDE3219030.1 hypothetical protein [Nitrospirota bacterium]
MMQHVKWYIICGLVGGLLDSSGMVSPTEAGPPPAYTQEHAITIDATTIDPQTWWQVPGVTPSIYSSDPESMDAYKTTESRALKLKPGKYKFGTFTFDFPFTVNLDGKLEYSHSLDQCVEGRATQTLTIRCSRTYPHGGQRDQYYQ